MTNADPPVVYDSQRQQVRLGAPIGAGGEGTVYHLADDAQSVAKIWHQDQRTPTTRSKIQVMVDNPPASSPSAGQPHPQYAPYVCWPQSILYDYAHNIVGYVMPKLDPSRHHDAFHFFNPAARERLQRSTARDRITLVTLLVIARNFANAVACLHGQGYVIGDINEKNILVNHNHDVTIVDADSFQVPHPNSSTVFRCLKGRDDYTPPRLQGARYADYNRTADDDAFGMAVVIFKLIMHGVHPYASTAHPDAATVSLADKIKNEYFPYNESGHTPVQHRPSATYQRAWQDLDFDIRHLFRRAFDPQATQGRNRPTPQQWVETLNAIIANPPQTAQRTYRRTSPSDKSESSTPAFGRSKPANQPTGTNSPQPAASQRGKRTAAAQPQPSPPTSAHTSLTVAVGVMICIAVVISITFIMIAITGSNRDDTTIEHIVEPTPTISSLEYEQQFYDPDLQVDFGLWVDFAGTPAPSTE